MAAEHTLAEEVAGDLLAAAITLEDRVHALRRANASLHDTLRAVARACTLPEDTAPASLPAQVEDCLRDLSGQVERRTKERDIAVARVEQLSRVFTNTATALDAVEILSSVLVEDAKDAPNCAEWRGSYGDRVFSITVQWVDGKSPHALIDEARRERDALRAQLATVTAALDSERLRTAAVPGALQAAMEALVPLASKAYRCCVGGIEPVDAPVTRATGGARDRPRLCLTRDLSVDNPRPWQAWLAGCDEALVTGATGDDHATPDEALADLREALEQAAGPPSVRWGDEGTMDHDATEGDDDDTESD